MKIRFRFSPYWKTPWTRLRFMPIHQGVYVKVGKAVRHECVGGCIFKGRLCVVNYRMPRLFDGKRTFRKALGNRVEIMLRNRSC